MTRSWRHNKETAWSPSPLQMAGNFKCPVTGPARELKWCHSIPFPIIFSTQMTLQKVILSPSIYCSIIDYRLWTTGHGPPRVVVRITIKPCVQSTQYRAPYSGSHIAVHFETPRELWKKTEAVFQHQRSCFNWFGVWPGFWKFLKISKVS